MNTEKIIEAIFYTENTVFEGINHTKAKLDIMYGPESGDQKCSVAFANRKYPFRFGLHDIFKLENRCRSLLKTDPILKIFVEKWIFHGQKDIFVLLKKIFGQWKRNSIDYITQQTGLRRVEVERLIIGAEIELFLAPSGLFYIEVIPTLTECNSDDFLGSTFKGTTMIPSSLFTKGGGQAAKKMQQEVMNICQIFFLERMEKILKESETPITPENLFSKTLKEKVEKEYDESKGLWNLAEPKYITIFLATFAIALSSPTGSLMGLTLAKETKN